VVHKVQPVVHVQPEMSRYVTLTYERNMIDENHEGLLVCRQSTFTDFQKLAAVIQP